MAAKHNPRRPGPTSPATPSDTSFPFSHPHTTRPPVISGSSMLLASAIQLPDNFYIAYAQFKPTSSSSSHQISSDIEVARIELLKRNGDQPVLDSLLTSVRLSRDESCLWVFAFGTSEESPKYAVNRLKTLNFSNLLATSISHFAYRDIYPCSVPCSKQLEPCPNCLNSSVSSSHGGLGSSDGSPSEAHLPSAAPTPSLSPTSTSRELSSATHFPRKPLRLPYMMFMDAVRDRLINDICEAAKERGGRDAKRLRKGFLLGPVENQTEWGLGWEHHNRSRPLIHCHLAVSLHPSHILIHPHLRPTYFLPLLPSLPLPSGAPITLLPFSTPAYYLNTYSGSTSALVEQFETCLLGLGAGDWTSHSSSKEGKNDEHKTMRGLRHGKKKSASFILAWVNVQNKHGEDKGIFVIWPMRLCVALLSTSTANSDGTTNVLYAYGRQALVHIPELPAPLQSSPVPAPATVPAQPHSTLAETPASVSAPTPMTLSASSPMSPCQPISVSTDTEFPRRPQITRSRTSVTSDTLKAFRSLVLSQSPSSDLRKVAVNVGRYVDAVAKERERERERIRRGREAIGQSPRLGHATSSITATPSGAASIAREASRTPVTSSASPGGVATSQTLSQSTNHSEGPSPPRAERSLQPPPTSAQNFYATPPEEDQASVPPLFAGRVTAAGSDTGHSLSDTGRTFPHESIQESHTSSAPFDPFVTIDNAWDRNTDFIIDLSMDFNMNVSSVSEGTGGGRNAMDVDVDGFGVFTDDDFSFFDGPSHPEPTASTIPPPVHTMGIESGTGLTPTAGPAPSGFSPSIFSDGLNLGGPGPLANTPRLSHPSPWMPSILTEAFETPKFAVMHSNEGGTPPAPELLPPSPANSPSTTHSDPTTPAVQFAVDSEIYGRKQLLELKSTVFTPIPFADSHRLADVKYCLGKFALPSPPDEVDRTESFVLPAHVGEPSWKWKYASVTDPRVAVVKKLIGVKRKITSQGAREPACPTSGKTEHQEWSSNRPKDTVEDMDSKSELESEDDDPWIEEDDDPLISRPSTPLPSYLPPGPSLLATRFVHSELLPKSSNLRPSGAAFATTDMPSSASISVPTPVSPAAILGATSERTKSLEAAVQLIGREVVENSLWAEAWRINSFGQSFALKYSPSVWQLDIQYVEQLIRSVEALNEPLDVKQLVKITCIEHDETQQSPEANSPVMSVLESPMLSVGKMDAIIQVLPSALRFWDRLGLGPRGGTKNIAAYALFEDKDEDRQNQVEEWLKSVSAAYIAKGFGSHSPGHCSTKDGLVPLRFDSFRKTLGQFLSTLNPSSEFLLFYVVTPSSILTLTSPVLRQVISGIKRALTNHSDRMIYFQFVPEYLIIGTLECPSARQAGFEPLVDSVYDRILRPVDRTMSQQFIVDGENIRKNFEAPAFTLARTLPSRTSLVWKHPSPSFGVMDRHTLLHVGYRLSSCGKWIIAACVDERGETHDLGVWLTQDDCTDSQVVSQLWDFAMQFARQANIEWRIAFAKLGTMGESELDAWISHLSTEFSVSQAKVLMQVSVVCVEQESAWTFLHSDLPKYPIHNHQHLGYDRGSNGSFFVDAASSVYTLTTLLRCPLTVSGDCDLGTDYPYVPDDDETAPCDELGAMPLYTSALIRVPSDTDSTSICVTYIHLLHTIKSPGSTLTKLDQATHYDITRNYHELAVLAQTRWQMSTIACMPFHLAALQIMHSALERGDNILE